MSEKDNFSSEHLTAEDPEKEQKRSAQAEKMAKRVLSKLEKGHNDISAYRFPSMMIRPSIDREVIQKVNENLAEHKVAIHVYNFGDPHGEDDRIRVTSIPTEKSES